MTTNVLRVKGAVRRFGDSHALAGVSIHVEAGERVALLGPNGAGKTTLIRSIAGLSRLDAGTITISGAPADVASRSRLGLVPQELAIHDLLTAEENLRLVGRLHGVTGSALRDRVAEALEWTGLTPRKGDLAKTFSGGMKRRLNIACGVLHEPDLLLLDEPTVGVDPQSRERIREMLAGLHARGMAVLLTTHMMDEAAQQIDRVIIIDHGSVIANGTLDSLINEHFGSKRRMKVAPATSPLPGGWTAHGSSMWRDLESVSDAVGVLTDLQQAGTSIEGLEVEAPTLQDVFIHLTGRDLRE
ncbi:MAG: ABC transporter ATP-binding protein [Planctomycetes bacterium]|nr:ABC transporter ATP-binding protein [Planctomycetota bacterium]MCP4837910.1 ABC transporter ATP-binding protein [Planctomycetota bacterium]